MVTQSKPLEDGLDMLSQKSAVTSYQPQLRNISEARRSLSHIGGNLKTCIFKIGSLLPHLHHVSSAISYAFFWIYTNCAYTVARADEGDVICV